MMVLITISFRLIGFPPLRPVNLCTQPISPVVIFIQASLNPRFWVEIMEVVFAPDETNLLTASWVREIAERHNKTSAQILLRYLLQRNIIVIPKSANPKRIVENSKIFDFTLTDDEMQVLNTSGLNERQFKFP
ncbi:hypothetical protein T265_15606, partial [Opisthorchis viverrini]